jgi:hypothetical protein
MKFGAWAFVFLAGVFGNVSTAGATTPGCLHIEFHNTGGELRDRCGDYYPGQSLIISNSCTTRYAVVACFTDGDGNRSCKTSDGPVDQNDSVDATDCSATTSLVDGCAEGAEDVGLPDWQTCVDQKVQSYIDHGWFD